jgi:site-specific recombinase XerD
VKSVATAANLLPGIPIKEYLFNGQFTNQYSETSLQSVGKKVHSTIPHASMRHSNATAFLKPEPICVISKSIGPSKCKTTEVYCHVSTAMLSKLHLPV